VANLSINNKASKLLNKQLLPMQKKHNIFSFIVLLSFVLFSFAMMFYSPPSMALTSLQASIDKNPLMSNESLILTVIADDSVDREKLDTTNLLKHFIISRTSVSSQTSMVNFTTSKTTRWTIVLIPRNSGDLEIGPLSVDNIQSQPISVKVVDIDEEQATGSKHNQQQDIFLTTETSHQTVYVQQLLTLKVKLHIAVNLDRASLSEPSFPHGVIKPMGEDVETQQIINGKRYRIIERSFAITPEKSGDYNLVTPSFSGEVLQQSRRRSSFFNMNDTKPVHVLGKKIPIIVKPVPDTFETDQNAWLPSEMLSLHQEWQPEETNFVVGEPITRTITLTAAGVSQEQLPLLKMQPTKGIKVYPDQAKNNSRAASNRLVSQKKQNFALVVNRPGKYTIPAMNIYWWNTTTNKAELATLPEQIITVNENPDADYQQSHVDNNSIHTSTPVHNTLSNANNEYANEDKTLNSQQLIEQQAILEELQKSVNNNARLMWLFLGLWLVTVLGWCLHIFIFRKEKVIQNKELMNKAVQKKMVASQNNAYHQLLAACKQNNSKDATLLIVPWFNQLNTANDFRASSIEQAIDFINDANLTKLVTLLQQSLYGKVNVDTQEQASWDGTALAKTIQKHQQQGINIRSKNEISLNP
jgi:hypothetical protein